MVAGSEFKVLVDFVNTRSLGGGEDAIETPDALVAWLTQRRLVTSAPRSQGVRATAREHSRARQLREGLRALLVGNNLAVTGTTAAPVDRAVSAVARLAAQLPLVLDVRERPPVLRPASSLSRVDEGLARILVLVAGARSGDDWGRLKACRDPTCQWAYYDGSRNRSRTWCSMSECGNRAKARTYRRKL